MKSTSERRRERRLRYHWPVWFAEDFAGMLSQGQMVDVCSGGAAFTCYSDMGCPYPGQHITTRFGVPCYGPDDNFDMADFIRAGHVCRIDHLSSGLARIAIQFFEPLPFKPGEQPDSESQSEPAFKAAMS